MSWKRGDSGGIERLSPRRRRAVGLTVLALVVVGATGIAFLRSSVTLRTTPTPAVPPSSPLLAGPNPVIYDFVTPSVGWATEDLNTPTTPAGGFSLFKTTALPNHSQTHLQLHRTFL